MTLTRCQKVLPALFRIGISLPTKIIIIIIIIVINNTINITTHETSRTAVLGKGVYKESFSHNSGRHSEGLISYKLLGLPDYGGSGDAELYYPGGEVGFWGHLGGHNRGTMQVVDSESDDELLRFCG